MKTLTVGEIRKQLEEYSDGDAVMLSQNCEGGTPSIALQDMGGALGIRVWLSQKRYDEAQRQRREER